MNVVDWMNAHPVTVHPDESATRARALLEKFRINQLPVISEGRLIGILTDRDLRDAFPSVFSAAAGPTGRARGDADPDRMRVSNLMTTNVLTASPDDAMQVAAALMRQERIGALPVVQDDRVVGILTRSDVLAAFLRLHGERADATSQRAQA